MTEKQSVNCVSCGRELQLKINRELGLVDILYCPKCKEPRCPKCGGRTEDTYSEELDMIPTGMHCLDCGTSKKFYIVI